MKGRREMKTLEDLGVSPAPWYGCLDSVIGADRWKVADMEFWPCPARDYSDANCRLIAAAPDLYAALRMCLALVDDEVADEDPRLFAVRACDAIQAARAALEKAGGETKGGANQGEAVR